METLLLVNDDGPYSEGLSALREKFLDRGYNVYVFVPHQEMSACSHSLTLTKPLHVREIKKNFFIVDGTPSDCTYLALFHFLKDKNIDYVISGINRGYNMGEDVFYSGTVAGAMEAFFHGISAIAVSSKNFDKVDEISGHFVNLFEKLKTFEKKKPFLLNINYPESEIKGIKITSLSSRVFPGNVEVCVDPRGVKSYWIGGVPAVWNGEENSDIHVVKDGYVSITPLQADVTDRQTLKVLSTFLLDI